MIKKTIIISLLIILAVIQINIACNFLNSDSDIGVIIGVLILVCFVFYGKLYKFLINSKQKNKQQ